MIHKQPEYETGSSGELSLRVSVAVLVNLSFLNPLNGKTMLALERTATLRRDKNNFVVVRAKPFGGAVRLNNPKGLTKRIGAFNYDSMRSLEQGDFRIQINPEQWENVKEICKEHLKNGENEILDFSPYYELAEEFEDCLNFHITPEKYHLTSRGMLIEDAWTETNNVNAPGLPTVRIYYIFNAVLKDQEIIDMVIENSRCYTDIDLQKMATENARRGGKGRANAVLTVVLDELKNFYYSIPIEKRKNPVNYNGHQLDGNVAAIL